MPRLLFQAPAKSDTREAFDWYEARSTGLGFEFLRAVRAALAAVERNPAQFPVVVDDIRRVRVRRFPYSMFYVVLPEATRILAVMHDRRDPQRWLSRR